MAWLEDSSELCWHMSGCRPPLLFRFSLVFTAHNIKNLQCLATGSAVCIHEGCSTSLRMIQSNLVISAICVNPLRRQGGWNQLAMFFNSCATS